MPGQSVPSQNVTDEERGEGNDLISVIGDSVGAEVDVVEGAEPVDHAGRATVSFAWSLLGFFLLQLGGFGTFTVAAKILPTSELGIVATLSVLVFWVDVLLDLGMGASLIYEQGIGQDHRVKVAFTVNTFVGVVVSGSLALSAPLLADYFKLDDPNLFRVIALMILAKSLNQIPDALLKRDFAFKRRMAADLTRAILRFGVVVTLLLAGVGVWSMVIGTVAAEVAAMVVTWVMVRFRPALRWDFGVARELLQFGFAMFASRLVGMIWVNGDYLIVGNHYGSNSTQFAFYATAFRLPELVIGSAYNLFSGVAFPMYSAAKRASMDTLRAAVLRSLRLLTLLGFAVGAGMALVARDVLPILFNAQFEGAARTMTLLCLGAGFVGVGFATGDLFPAIGKPRLGLYFQLLGAPILVTGFVLFVGRGIEAIALVHLVVIVPYSIFRMWVTNRIIATTWAQQFRSLVPAFSVTAGIVAFGLPVRLLTSGGFGSLVAIVAAGTVGAGVGMLVGGGEALHEMKGLAAKVIPALR